MENDDFNRRFKEHHRSSQTTILIALFVVIIPLVSLFMLFLK